MTKSAPEDDKWKEKLKRRISKKRSEEQQFYHCLRIQKPQDELEEEEGTAPHSAYSITASRYPPNQREAKKPGKNDEDEDDDDDHNNSFIPNAPPGSPTSHGEPTKTTETSHNKPPTIIMGAHTGATGPHTDPPKRRKVTNKVYFSSRGYKRRVQTTEHNQQSHDAKESDDDNDKVNDDNDIPPPPPRPPDTQPMTNDGSEDDPPPTPQDEKSSNEG